MEPDVESGLRQGLAEAWAEVVLADPKDRKVANERYRALVQEFTAKAQDEKRES